MSIEDKNRIAALEARIAALEALVRQLLEKRKILTLNG